MAVQTPLRCYGLEYQSGDPVCQKCPHRDGCQRVSTVRRGKVPLSRVEFNLLPSSLEETQIKGQDNVEKLYQTLYTLVYPGQQPDSLYKHKDAEHRLRAISDEVGCSPRLYILCCLLARRTLCPDARFFANYLFAKNSSKLVEEFKDMAKEKYGSFDYESLSQLTGGDELTRASARIRNSEVLAGRWILGYKIKRAGSPIDAFYSENEIRLDPIWLALEPSYIDFHNKFDGISESIRNHRMETRRVWRWLRKNRHVAVNYYEHRSRLFKDSVAEVLGFYGYALDDFESPPLVHDAMKFWGRLALAIQHVGCLRLAGFLD